MSLHHFKVGAIVSFDTGAKALPLQQATYVVEAQMPPVGDNLQYRIKSEAEGFRRVVVEHQLSSWGDSIVVEPGKTYRRLPGEED